MAEGALSIAQVARLAKVTSRTCGTTTASACCHRPTPTTAGGASTGASTSELAKARVPVDDERVLDAVAGHYEWIKNHWTPNAESHAGLGRVYAEDERFREQYEAVHPGFADYLRDALAAFAAARLSE
ncbi:TipAS antibiotic-recognition domain-containing protein [Amycolatopsis acidiphila]|nr:TipAS antibiotic-recognition domain-containing protein [Amycolatopsis acidiphila]UIJ59466.1 TipAS antibiotic-recognition domain-containing protein [Amycolatopsis acidiphila]